MSETSQLSLPLLAAAQAQKHVTVNEALARLDAAVPLRVRSAAVDTPPADAADGAAWLVPAAGGGAWSGHAGEIAVRANGGWQFLVPKLGWRLWNEAEAAPALFDGTTWQRHAQAVEVSGAATRSWIATADHAVAAGAQSVTAALIPASSLVIGVTARVRGALTGAGVTAWQLGVAADPTRYGTGLGLSVNSFAMGLSGSPQAYYAATPLILTAVGGTFLGGSVRLAVHLTDIVPPRAA